MNNSMLGSSRGGSPMSSPKSRHLMKRRGGPSSQEPQIVQDMRELQKYMDTIQRANLSAFSVRKPFRHVIPAKKPNNPQVNMNKSANNFGPQNRSGAMTSHSGVRPHFQENAKKAVIQQQNHILLQKYNTQKYSQADDPLLFDVENTNPHIDSSQNFGSAYKNHLQQHYNFGKNDNTTPSPDRVAKYNSDLLNATDSPSKRKASNDRKMLQKMWNLDAALPDQSAIMHSKSSFFIYGNTRQEDQDSPNAEIFISSLF